MNIAILGARGMIGQQVVLEALVRVHIVKALTRDKGNFPIAHPRLSVEQVDIFDATSIASAVANADVVVNATGIGQDLSIDPQRFFVDSTRAVIEGVKRAGDKRLLVVGGAGSLEVAPGLQLVDAPEFPDLFRGVANAQRETLAMYRASDLNWTFFSPSAVIEPGRRTGKYRLGGDQLLTNEQGESYISVEDFAHVLLDEIEQPQFVCRRLTAVSLIK